MEWSFSQAEYSNGMLSAFLIFLLLIQHTRESIILKEDLVLNDTTYKEALGTSVSTQIL